MQSLVNLHLYCKATQLTYSTAWKHNTNCSTMNASRPRKTAHWLLEWIIQHQTSIKASPCSLCSSQTLIEIPKQSHSAKDICPLNMVSNESFRKTWMDKKICYSLAQLFSKVAKPALYAKRWGTREGSHWCQGLATSWTHIHQSGTMNGTKDYILLLGK